MSNAPTPVPTTAPRESEQMTDLGKTKNPLASRSLGQQQEPELQDESSMDEAERAYLSGFMDGGREVEASMGYEEVRALAEGFAIEYGIARRNGLAELAELRRRAAPLPTAPTCSHPVESRKRIHPDYAGGAERFVCELCGVEVTAPEVGTPGLSELLDALLKAEGAWKDCATSPATLRAARDAARTAIEARFAEESKRADEADAWTLEHSAEIANYRAARVGMEAALLELRSSLAQVEGERDDAAHWRDTYRKAIEQDEARFTALEARAGALTVGLEQVVKCESRYAVDDLYCAEEAIEHCGAVARAALGSSRSGASHVE